MVRRSSNAFAIRCPFVWRLCRCGFERRLGLRHGAASVVFGVRFILCAVVGDALNDDFVIVAAGEGALGVSPIVFGLALVFAGNGPSSFLAFAKVAWRFGGVFVNREIAERVDRIAFLARLNDKFLGKFVVGESG